MKSIFASLLLLLAFTTTGCQAKSLPDELSRISDQIDESDDDGDEAESALLSLREKNPKNPEVPTLLARIEYLRSVSGIATVPGMPMADWDEARMDAAERWIRQAVELDPKHANAWIVYGQINFARNHLAESLEMLEKAEALDPSSVKLRLRKGATLRSLAWYRGDDALLDAAATEYQRAIRGKIDDGNERLAASELGEIFRTRKKFEKSLAYLTDALVTSEGSEKAFMLDKRAETHLFAGDVDAAIADSHAALDILDFGVGRTKLAMALLVKSGVAMRDGDSASATSHAMEAYETGVDIRLLHLLNHSPKTFPAVYAFLEPNMKAAGGDKLAVSALCGAGEFISKTDLLRLNALGADLDFVDPQQGTLLHCAIMANNVEAVDALLELGADTNIRHPDGRSLLETTLIGTNPARREIRRLVLAKVGTPAGWKDPEVDLPVKNHWYKAERRIGSATQKVIEAGSILLADGGCSFQNSTDICLSFDTKPGEYFGTVAIPLARLEDLKALREVPAPVEPALP